MGSRCGMARARADAAAMQTNIHEIADGVYRLSTCVPEVAPGGFTFNQYLIDAEEPLLFHTGPRQMFDLVAPAAAQVLDIERLRWISFGHVESDECGAMNRWLEAAPQRRGHLQRPRLRRLAQRPGRPPAGGRRATTSRSTSAATGSSPSRPPTCPTAGRRRWSFDETTGTLFCGDLFTQVGDGPALVHDADLIGPALAAEDMFQAPPASPPDTAPTLRRLADLEPRTLALMHGPAFVGDCAGRPAASWPTPTRPASAPRASRRWQREHHPEPTDAKAEPMADHRPLGSRTCVRSSGPRRPALAEAEVARMVAALRSLDADDWTRPTDCPRWDVRAMAGHVLGMTETFSGLGQVRLVHAGRRQARRRRPLHRRAHRRAGRRHRRAQHRRAHRPPRGGGPGGRAVAGAAAG